MFSRVLDSLKVNIKMYIFTILTFLILTIYLLLSTNTHTLYTILCCHLCIFLVEGLLAL